MVTSSTEGAGTEATWPGIEPGTYAGAHVGERVRVDTRRRGHADVVARMGAAEGYVVARLAQPGGMGTPVTGYGFVGLAGDHPLEEFMLDVPFVEEPGVLLRDGDGATWFAPLDGEAVRVSEEPGPRAYGAFATLGISTLGSFWDEPRMGRFRVTEGEDGTRVVDALLAFRTASPSEAMVAEEAVARAGREVAP